MIFPVSYFFFLNMYITFIFLILSVLLFHIFTPVCLILLKVIRNLYTVTWSLSYCLVLCACTAVFLAILILKVSLWLHERLSLSCLHVMMTHRTLHIPLWQHIQPCIHHCDDNVTCSSFSYALWLVAHKVVISC